LSLLLLTGCVPDLASECAGVGDCPVERPVCFAGVCTAEIDETEPDAFDFSGILGDDGPDGDVTDDAAPDAAPARDPDAGRPPPPHGPDAGRPPPPRDRDAGPPPPGHGRDAGPPPAGECGDEVCNGVDDDCDGKVDEKPGKCHGHGHHGCDEDCDEDARE
jgi:hypothetical protein